MAPEPPPSRSHRAGAVPPGAAPDVRLASATGRWVLVATVLGSSLAAIDGTVVGIALPSIGREFHAPLSAMQWVLVGYSLSLTSLLLLGGSLGDRFGRRRVFLIGVVWFVAASTACALAPSPSVLIVMRVLQGVGAALLTPGSLAIIEAAFSSEDRGAAIGWWSGLGGVATAVGPLLGGYLVTVASWRWIFVINLPLGALTLVLASRHVPESRDPDAASRIDVAGAALGMVALAAGSVALVEGGAGGLSTAQVTAVGLVAVAAGIGFVVRESTARAPMLPLGFLRVRQFTGTNLVTFAVYAALGGVLFLLPIQLQVVVGLTPFEAGLGLLPVPAVMLALSARSGRVAARIGPRLQMTAGPLVVGLGLVLLALGAGDRSYASGMLPGIVVIGLGLAVTVAPLTATALDALPSARAGIASAVNNDVARLGGLLAVAVLPALSGLSGADYLQASRLTPGFRTAMLVAAGCCAAGGVLAASLIRNPVGARQPEATATCYACALDAPVTASSRGGRSGSELETP